jgi:hypothetical protein
MRFKFAVSAGLSLLLAGASVAHADKKKAAKEEEVPSNFNKQFEWENHVVGPKAGLDKDKIAAIQEKGRKDEEARKKEPPKKVGRAEGVDAPASASLPTMDIEKPSTAPAKKQKKVAEVKQKDALDNLLDDQGVKPNRPDGSGDGLGSVFASDDKGSSSKKTAGKKASKRR